VRIHHLGNVGERDRREPGSFYALFGLGRAGVGRLFPSEAQEILGRVERAVRRAARAAVSAPGFAMLLPDYIGTLVPAAVVMKPLDWDPVPRSGIVMARRRETPAPGLSGVAMARDLRSPLAKRGDGIDSSGATGRPYGGRQAGGDKHNDGQAERCEIVRRKSEEK
jgi:hypothetical protein